MLLLKIFQVRVLQTSWSPDTTLGQQPKVQSLLLTVYILLYRTVHLNTLTGTGDRTATCRTRRSHSCVLDISGLD